MENMNEINNERHHRVRIFFLVTLVLFFAGMFMQPSYIMVTQVEALFVTFLQCINVPSIEH